MEKGGWETGNRSCETGYRGRETRNRYVTQGTEDERQGTGDIGWETKYKDVREGTKDIRQGQEKGTEEWVTGGREEKL
jgi:hypothetical protein